MDSLDRILVTEGRLAPSSGFQSRVMDAVKTEQAKLPPLRFPWTRFAAGVVACLVWAIAGALIAERIDWSALSPALAVVVSSSDLAYAVLAVCASLVIVAIPRLRGLSPLTEWD